MCISIIIPLYNKENSVKNTIESVLSQSFSHFELIIIDDGSSDGSLSIAESFNDKRIKIFQQSNKGVCSARNRGIAESSFDYIAFLDADDIWDKDYLLEQSMMIKDFPDAGLLGLNFAEVDRFGNQTILDSGLPDSFRGYIIDYFGQKRVSDLFSSSSVVVKKDCFRVVGLFDERIKYSEDLDMWYRIILNYPVAFNSQIKAYYLQSSENRAMNKKISLVDFLPFYIDKYDNYCADNKEFAHFIHTFAAAKILPYYFYDADERKYAKEAIKRLRYQDIHYKWSLLYKTPMCIGILFWKIIEHRHKIK